MKQRDSRQDSGLEKATQWYACLTALIEACGDKKSNFWGYAGAPSHPTINKARDGEELSEDTNRRVVSVLNSCLIPVKWATLETREQKEHFTAHLQAAAPGCIRVRADESPIVEERALYEVYEQRVAKITVILDARPEKASETEAQVHSLLEKFAKSNPAVLRVRRIRRSSLKIELYVSGRDAKQFKQMLEEPSLREQLKVREVTISSACEPNHAIELIPNPFVDIDLSSEEYPSRIRMVSRVEHRSMDLCRLQALEPLARILAHLAYSVRFFALLMPFKVLNRAGFNRYLGYENSILADAPMKPSAQVELMRIVPHWLLWWPLLTFALCLVLNLPALLAGAAATALLSSLSAVALAASGSFYCASAVSTAGSAAAGVPLALGFAYAHMMACLALGGGRQVMYALEATDPFTRIVGGIPGATIASVAKFSWFGALSSLGCCSLAIGLTAAIMPGPVERAQEARARGRPALGAFLGFLAGFSCVGAVKGLSFVFGNDSRGFCLAFLLVGSLAFAMSLGLRAVDWKSILVWSGFHIFFSATLLLGALRTTGIWQFFFNSSATAGFHATFFVLSAVVGQRIGGRKAAVQACAWEGCLGFAGFALLRLVGPGFALHIPLIIWLIPLGIVSVPVIFGPKRPRTVRLLGQVLPPVAAIACFTLFVLLPAFKIPLGLWPRWLHQFGAVLLGAFLAVGFLLQLGYRFCLTRSRDFAAALLAKWWSLTEAVPAVAALLILSSALRLLFEIPAYSIAVGYIGCMFLGFAVFFVDGLTFYRPEVSKLYRQMGAGGAVRGTLMKPSLATEVQFALHAISFPVVFWLGYAKPQFNSPLALIVIPLEAALAPRLGLPLARVFSAVLLLLAVALVLILIRRPWKRAKEEDRGR